jgi:hypothetical protein
MISLGSAPDRKSSYSTGQNNCVVVGSPEVDTVRVRDSKVPSGRPVRVSPSAFAAFARSL